MTVAEQSISSNSEMARRNGRRARKIREAIEAYLFLLPGTLILLTFNLLPIFYALYISMHKWRIQKGKFIGLENYLKALGTPSDILSVLGGLALLAGAWTVWKKIKADDTTSKLILKFVWAFMLLFGGLAFIIGFPKMLADGDEMLFKALLITFYYSIGTVPFQILFSFLLATVLFQDIKGKTMWRIIFFLPYVTVTVASAAVWQSIFDPSKGLLNITLGALGVPEAALPKWLFEAQGINVIMGHWLGIDIPSWAGGPSLALVAVMIYNIWTFVGYNSVIYLAGLGNIPHSLYEAAEIDGASRWDMLRHVTLPLVSPTTYFLTMMGILGTFRAFNHIYVMTQVVGPVGSPRGTTMTASMLIWKNFWDGNRFGYASALAFVLAGVMLSLTWIQGRIAEGRVHYG